MLEENRNCWRKTHARRVTLLVLDRMWMKGQGNRIKVLQVRCRNRHVRAFSQQEHVLECVIGNDCKAIHLNYKGFFNAIALDEGPVAPQCRS